MLKYSFNLIDDGLVGQQLFAGEATRLAYMAEEAVEGRDSFLEKRDPDFSRSPGMSDDEEKRRRSTVIVEVVGGADEPGGAGRGRGRPEPAAPGRRGR